MTEGKGPGPGGPGLSVVLPPPFRAVLIVPALIEPGPAT